MDEHHNEDSEFGPTYKSLFLGACLVIGSGFGWWFTGFINTYDTLVSRVAQLEIRDTENKWTFRINTSKIDSLEARIQELERRRDAGPMRGKE